MTFLAKLGTSFRNGFTTISGFIRDGWAELKKVRWPNRRELTNYTIVVFTTVIFVTLYFVVLDMGISRILEFILGE